MQISKDSFDGNEVKIGIECMKAYKEENGRFPKLYAVTFDGSCVDMYMEYIEGKLPAGF